MVKTIPFWLFIFSINMFKICALILGYSVCYVAVLFPPLQMQVNIILTVVALCLRLFLSVEAARGPLEGYFILVQFDIPGR
jgi:hypothetical protein